ncbi:MAG: hypothetical protein AAF633_10060 [Chloroflexota bacterium]
MSDPTQTTQAEYFYDALVSKFPGLGTDIFQFSTTPLPASWVSGNPYDEYSWASGVSQNVGGYYVPGSNFFNAYKSLVMSLKVPDPNKDPNYRTTLTSFDDLDSQLKVEMQSAHANYTNWKAQNTDASGNAPNFDTWLKSTDGFADNAKIMNLQQQITAIQSNLTRIILELESPYKDATEGLTKDTVTITWPNGEAQTLPRFGIGGNLVEDKSNWDSAPEGQFDLDLTLTGEATVTHPWKILYQQSVSEKCLSFQTENKINVARIIQDKAYSLNFKAVGAASYPIERGSWYQPTIVNPDIPIEPSSDITPQSLFGINGALHLVPSAFFVIYKPTMTLTVTTTTYEQYIKGQAGASVNWLNIFGIRFDVSQGSGIIEKSGPETTTITMPIPGTNTPQIIGLQSKNTFLAP